MHIDAVSIDGALDLDGLRAVTLLCVQLTPVHRLDVHDVSLPSMRPTCVVRCRYYRLASRIESKVGLIHELLIEARIDGCVVVGDGALSIMMASTLGSSLDLGTIFE